MNSKILIVDDDPKDQKKFKRILKAAGRRVLIVGHPYPSRIASKIKEFGPDLAIVDCLFSTDIDGLSVIKQLCTICPSVPITICTQLFDDPTKKRWVIEQYKGVPNVRRMLGKKPFPTIEDLLEIKQN